MDTPKTAVWICDCAGLISDHLDTGRVRRYFKLTPVAMLKLKESRRQLARLWEGVETVLDEV